MRIHKRSSNLIRSLLALILSLSMVIACAPVQITAYAADGSSTHNIAIASGRHGNEEAVGSAFSGMPTDMEYVCLGGDMVDKGEYDSSMLLSEVQTVFGVDESGNQIMTNKNVSVLYGYSHDKDANDDAGIMYGKDAGDSGLLFTGHNSDGTPAYYIYEVAYYDMSSKSAQTDSDAAKEFVRWVKEEAQASVPIIVVCHMPLHYQRKDNGYAVAWNKALNYAATGVEDLTASGHEITRNVIFLHGHNHTTEKNAEYYIPVGSTMEIFSSDYPSYIYYTYTTAGYLRDNKAATLIAVDNEKITVSKYSNGAVTSTYAAQGAKSQFSDTYDTDATHVIKRVRNDQQLERPYDAIVAKMAAKGKKQFNVRWNKVAGAAGYDIFMAKCGKNCSGKFKLKRVKTVKGEGSLSWTTPSGLKVSGSSMRANTGYKMRVKAYVLTSGGKKKYVSSSPVVHAFTGGYSGTLCNPKCVTLKTKAQVSLKAGKTYTIKATVAKLKQGKKLITKDHAKPLRYLSSDKNIATVTSSGKIKGVSPGTCRIHVYAANGVFKKVKVEVRQ